jgi:hypothetical protein
VNSVSIDTARKIREQQFQTAKQLMKLSLHQQYAWSDLSDIPNWCLWSESEIIDLRRVAGALLFAPVFQSLVDGRKIAELRDLVGKVVLEEVMNTELDAMPQSSWEIRHFNLRELVDTAGCTVIYSVINDRALAILHSHGFPSVNQEKLPLTIAREVLNETLRIYDSKKGAM